MRRPRPGRCRGRGHAGLRRAPLRYDMIWEGDVWGWRGREGVLCACACACAEGAFSAQRLNSECDSETVR